MQYSTVTISRRSHLGFASLKALFLRPTYHLCNCLFRTRKKAPPNKLDVVWKLDEGMYKIGRGGKMTGMK